jgi:hypothetical protein
MTKILRYRVIFTLEDGKRIYAMSGGKPEIWHDYELKILDRAIKENNIAGYTEDLKTFVSPDDMKIANKKTVRISGYTTESVIDPVQEDLLIK